jgi:hypothetical protein
MEDEMGGSNRTHGIKTANLHKILAGKSETKKLLCRCVDGRIILKWILKKQVLMELTGFQ